MTILFNNNEFYLNGPGWLMPAVDSQTPWLVPPSPSVQFSHVQLFATLWTAAHQASLSFAISLSLLKFMSTESVMVSKHFSLCCPFLLLPSIVPSIRIFSSELAFYIRWPKYWSFSFSISPSNECSGLISFRIDWFNILAVQGTRKSLLQHHSSKASNHQFEFHDKFLILTCKTLNKP